MKIAVAALSLVLSVIACAVPAHAQRGKIEVYDVAFTIPYMLEHAPGQFEPVVVAVHFNGDATVLGVHGVVSAYPIDGNIHNWRVFYTGPNVCTTCWIDKEGFKRTITTDCSGLTDDACQLKHDKMVRSALTKWPKDPDKNC